MEYRVKAAVIAMDATIDYLNEKGEDTAGLQDIRDQLSTVLDDVNETNLTGPDFADKVKEIRGLVKQFRDKAREMLTPDERQEVLKLIKDRLKEEDVSLGKIIKRERAIRAFHNMKAQNRVMKQIVKEAKEIKASSGRILKLVDRLKELRKLRKEQQSRTKKEMERLREQWKEQLEQFKEDSEEVKFKANRLGLVEDAVAVRKKIRDAKSGGEDISDLEERLREVNKQLRELRKEQVMDAKARARLNAAREKLIKLRENTAARARTISSQRTGMARTGVRARAMSAAEEGGEVA